MSPEDEEKTLIELVADEVQGEKDADFRAKPKDFAEKRKET